MRLGWRAKPQVEPKGSTAPLPLIGEDGRPVEETSPAASQEAGQAQQPAAQPQPAPPALQPAALAPVPQPAAQVPSTAQLQPTSPASPEGQAEGTPAPEADEGSPALAARHAAPPQDGADDAPAAPARRARHAAPRHAAPLPAEPGAGEADAHDYLAVLSDDALPTAFDAAQGPADAGQALGASATHPSPAAAEAQGGQPGGSADGVPSLPLQVEPQTQGEPAAPADAASAPKVSLEDRLPQVPPAPRRHEEVVAGAPKPGEAAQGAGLSGSSEVGAVLAAALPQTDEPARPSQDAAGGERAHGWRGLPLVLRCVFYVAIIGLIGSAILLNGCFGLLDGRVVPSVAGMGEDEARAALVAEGFEVEVEEQETQNAEDIGMVIATDPAAGTGTSSVGSPTVVVKVGKAREGTQEVPQLVGMDEQGALDAIASTNFFVKDDVMRAYSSTVPAGIVISQGPTAGTAKSMGTKIDLVISDGPAPGDATSPSDNTQTSVTIPDVTGMPFDDAVTLLQGMGLRVVEGDDTLTEELAKGSVASVEPGVDEPVSVGSTVTLHMAVPADSRNDGSEG